MSGVADWGEVVVVGAVKRQCQNRHVVDGFGFDERRRNAMRDAVEVRLQLLVQLHQAPLDVFTNGPGLWVTGIGLAILSRAAFVMTREPHYR